jgi:hypothetical protein
MQGKNDFVKFFIFSLVAKAFFDSATLFYPLIEREKKVSHIDVLSIVFQFRILVAVLLLLVSFFLHVNFILSFIFILSCITNLEFHFNLENDSLNLFIQSNFVRLFLTIILLLSNFSDDNINLIYVSISLVVSLYGFSFNYKGVSLRVSKFNFKHYQKMFYLTIPAVLNYGSREFGVFLMYNNLSSSIVLMDRLQKSVTSLTAALGPFTAAFPDKFRFYFYKYSVVSVLIIPVIMSLIFILFLIFYHVQSSYSIFFLASLCLGCMNYILQLFYFNLNGLFKDVYRMNVVYGVVGFLLVLILYKTAFYDFFPFIILIQESILFFSLLYYKNKNSKISVLAIKDMYVQN